MGVLDPITSDCWFLSKESFYGVILETAHSPLGSVFGLDMFQLPHPYFCFVAGEFLNYFDSG